MLQIDNHIKKLSALCKTHNVEKLYLFGSAINDNFNKQSDIDFLVSFNNIELTGYFENYITFKTKLKEEFKRKVDLIEVQTLKNPILINSINKTKKLIYG